MGVALRIADMEGPTSF